VHQPLGDAIQRRAHLANVERGVQVTVENIEIAVLAVVAACHLTDEKEIILAEVAGEFLDRAAEIARVFE